MSLYLVAVRVEGGKEESTTWNASENRRKMEVLRQLLGLASFDHGHTVDIQDKALAEDVCATIISHATGSLSSMRKIAALAREWHAFR